MNSKTKNIITWVLTGFVVLILAGSGIFKLTGGNEEMIKGLGGSTNLMILGILELIIVGLFLFTRTGVVGALLAIAYIGGAIAVHFTTNQSVLPLIGIQVLIWVASVLRFPELGHRLFKNINSQQ